MSTPRLIRPSDLELIGADPRQLAARSKRGELVRVRRGAYVEPADWNGLDEASRHGLKAAAFAQLAGSQPVFCHATAALLWGLWIVGRPARLHVITESTAGGRSRNGITRHIGSLHDGTLRCGPFLLTDKLTTTMQLVNSLAFPYAVAVCDSSLRPPGKGSHGNAFTTHGGTGTSGRGVSIADASGRGVQMDGPSWHNDVPQGPPLLVPDLTAAAERLPTRAARTRALAVIGFASGLSGSAGESLSRAKMHQLRFPVPELQRSFELRDGRNALVDFWFGEQRLVGEFDGLGKYLRADWGRGRPIQDRVIAEKQREDQIRAHGVGVVRWTWVEMMDRQRFQSLLRQAGLPQR